MKLENRKYEERAVANLRTDLASHKRVLAVSPTGSGKTVIAALLIGAEKRWRKVLWLAHRYELVDQAYKTLTGLGVDAGIVMAQEETLRGDARTNASARVQVASVQTIAARGVPDDIDLVVFDEAHRVMADSYQEIAESCAGADVLGLTATPCRADGRGLGEFFQFMRIVAQPSDLQADGYLAKPRTFSAPAGVLTEIEKGLQGATSSGGDYAPHSLAKAVDRSLLIGKVVSESIRIAPGVPKVVFACSVKHSKRIAKEFAAKGIAAEHVDGETQAADRERILKQLSSGTIEVICNVDVLSEGWDLPSLGAVIVARPTKSVARFLQMVGRVQRAHGEERPLVIDHGANVQRLDVLPGEDIVWQLSQGVIADGDKARVRLCVSCGAVMECGKWVCSECNEEHEDQRREEEERIEIEAKLEEVTRAELASIRERVERIAKENRASKAWAQRVYQRLTGSVVQ